MLARTRTGISSWGLPLLAGLAATASGCGGSGPKTPSSSGRQATPPAYQAARAPLPPRGGPPWPAPPNPLSRARAAGLVPERREQLAYHVHAHLDVFLNGQAVTVPAGIGINVSDPGVHQSPGPGGTKEYGGISQCAKPCISPLHTHDSTGILHTESATVTPNRLGQFFTEWSVHLTPTCVGPFCAPTAPIAIFVDGARFQGDPRQIGLANHREIAIVIGSPPAQIPAAGDFSGA